LPFSAAFVFTGVFALEVAFLIVVFAFALGAAAFLALIFYSPFVRRQTAPFL